MRKLVLHMMTTLDGFIADTDGRLNTNWTHWDDEMKISRTITEVAVGTVISEPDIVSALTALKNEDGSDILLYCGPKLLATLIALDLVDQYLVYINPIAIGRGLNLYQDLEPTQTLGLIDHKVFQSGVIMHRCDTGPS